MLRETNRSGGIGYVGVAKVQAIKPLDNAQAIWEVVFSDYLTFPNIVPLQAEGRYFERQAQSTARTSQIGRLFHGRAVRELSDDEFKAIVTKGFGLPTDVDFSAEPNRPVPRGFDQGPMAFDGEPRRIEQVLLNRPFRDDAFRRRVCHAYDYTCAVTRLCFQDGRGGFEVQAAHIVSVKDGGPDLIYNGLCLCSTAHWLFDHFMISVDLDFRLLINEARIQAGDRHVLPRAGTPLLLPRDERLAPHAVYLDRHRSEFERRLKDNRAMCVSQCDRQALRESSAYDDPALLERDPGRLADGRPLGEMKTRNVAHCGPWVVASRRDCRGNKVIYGSAPRAGTIGNEASFAGSGPPVWWLDPKRTP